MEDKEKYMKEAIKQAKKAYALGEVPIGCVIVYKGKIIGRGYNRRITDKTALAHAEITAIKKACKVMGDWRLDDCEMYVTLEPCTMCLGALIQSRIGHIYYGAIDSRFGAIEGSYKLLETGKFNHFPKTTYLDDKKCSKILSDYFKEKRTNS